MPNPPKKLVVDAVEKTLAEWSAEYGVPIGTIDSRLRAGWSVADAIRTPSDRRFRPRQVRASGNVRPCPTLRPHKASGQAFCQWRAAGEKHYRYFGKWGSPEAERAYAAFQAEWSGRAIRKVPTQLGQIVYVTDLVERWLDRCESWYVKDGKPTAEIHAHKSACSYLLSLHAATPVGQFGPDELREVRQLIIDQKLVRNTVNGYQSRIVHMFGWGVGERLVSADTWHVLTRVERLQRGRSPAPDRPRKRAVPWASVEAILPHLHWHEGRRAVLESLIRVHWLLGGRPQDLCGMTPVDIDGTGDLWEYYPDRHKNEHRDKELVYLIGPKAQALLTPLLADCPADRPVFTYPPRSDRGGKWWPISRLEYGRRVRAACHAAGITPWTPHQLRHSRATEVRRIYESNRGAAAVIGDSEDVTREIYTDPSDAVRRRIVRETG